MSILNMKYLTLRKASHNKHPKQFIIRLRSIIPIIVLLIFPFIVQFTRAQSEEFRVWFFDVGQGDATFVVTPSGKQILIDGGPDDSVLQKLSSVMWPWDHTIDAIIITHPDADHITGLISVLERYDVATIYETGVRGGTPMIQALDYAIKNENARNILVRAGQTLEWGNAQAIVFWPTDEIELNQKDRNNTSIVLKVLFGETSIVLTGDAEELVENKIGSTIGDVDILKTGHHGSKTSTSTTFLNMITPEVAVISNGKDNRYGHPHPIVLERLREIGARIFRTDLDGDILLNSDGQSYNISPAFLPF